MEGLENFRPDTEVTETNPNPTEASLMVCQRLADEFRGLLLEGVIVQADLYEAWEEECVELVDKRGRKPKTRPTKQGLLKTDGGRHKDSGAIKSRITRPKINGKPKPRRYGGERLYWRKAAQQYFT